MPIARNFLGALKHHPGVLVDEDRRIYDEAGNFVRKGTFYTLPTPPWRAENVKRFELLKNALKERAFLPPVLQVRGTAPGAENSGAAPIRPEGRVLTFDALRTGCPIS